jgi:peptidoglycan hydrolase CwlO-like protein
MMGPSEVNTTVSDEGAESAETEARVPLFGARREVRKLRDQQQQIETRNAEMHDQLQRLGALSVSELETRREELRRETEEQSARLAAERTEAAAALKAEGEAATRQLQQDIAEATSRRDELARQVTGLEAQVVETEEEAVLQEVGIYEYRHPLSAAASYKFELDQVKKSKRAMAKRDGGAILGSTNWRVNGSLPQGRAMVRDFSKLMLRAYNAEVDTLVRGLKPYKVESAIERLDKVVATIQRLGRTMDIRISTGYHRTCVKELELTADFLAKKEEEKELERAERDRLREERKAQQEMERERKRLEKERQHYLNSIAAVEAKGDDEAAGRMRDELAEIDLAIEDVDYRAANIRAGYVYVISNVGSFGDRIVKIGLTRRLDPTERVRELGDASVPFRFDVHAVVFSKDAVGIESELHQRLADRRVNRVNLRREFFYASPDEVKAELMDVAGDLLEWEESPEALEFHQSQTIIAGERDS